MRKLQDQFFFFAFLFICSVLIASCGRSKVVKSYDPSQLKKDTPLEDTYKKLIIHNFEIDQNMEKDFPGAAALCENSTMNELLHIGTIPIIEKARSKSLRETGTLILKIRITALKNFNGVTRTSAGASAGNSEMAVDLKLIDAATGKTLREKNFSTVKNAYGISRTGASSDRTLPSDLGKIIARYIADIVHDH